MKLSHEDMIARYQDTGDEQIKDDLFLSLEPMIYSILYGITHRSPVYDEFEQDIIQAGYIGINEALIRYNPKLSGFTTYAYFWITRYVIKEVAKINKFNRAHTIYDNEKTIGNLTSDGALPYVENKVFVEQFYTALTEFLDEMKSSNGQNKNIKAQVEMFKAKNYDEMTLQTVGEIAHLTRERIRQINKRIMERVQMHFKDWTEVVHEYLTYIESLNTYVCSVSDIPIIFDEEAGVS